MRPNGRAMVIHGGGHDIVAPPLGRVDSIHGQGEEDEERSQRQAQIQARRRQKVQAAPPSEVALLDPELEDEADDAPGEVVEGGGGRDGAGAAEEQRRDEVLDG